MLIERSDIVGSILTEKGADQLNDRDTRFCERAEWLLRCADASRCIRPIVVKRWKIPIRFDPQSQLAQWAVERELDLSETNLHFERDFASCIEDFAPSKGNRKGHLRLQLFQRWHRASDIQVALQREEELKWILQEARKAELLDDILKQMESKLKESQKKLQEDRWCSCSHRLYIRLYQ